MKWNLKLKIGKNRAECSSSVIPGRNEPQCAIPGTWYVRESDKSSQGSNQFDQGDDQDEVVSGFDPNQVTRIPSRDELLPRMQGMSGYLLMHQNQSAAIYLRYLRAVTKLYREAVVEEPSVTDQDWTYALVQTLPWTPEWNAHIVQMIQHPGMSFETWLGQLKAFVRGAFP